MDLTEIIQQAADESTIPVITAFLLGLLAAISPCPLATNISAMAYISREITKPKYVILSGILYTLGRMVSYFSIGALIIVAGTQTHHISDFLQDKGEQFIGPLLIVIGVIMLDFIKLPFIQGGGRLSSIGERWPNAGNWEHFYLAWYLHLLSVLIPLYCSLPSSYPWHLNQVKASYCLPLLQ